MTTTTERLTAAILADRARPTTQHNIVPCFVCGYTFVYKGRRGAEATLTAVSARCDVKIGMTPATGPLATRLSFAGEAAGR